MKKYIMLTACVSLIACSKNLNDHVTPVHDEEEGESITITAQMDESDPVKTTLDADKKIMWTNGDAITVLYGYNNTAGYERKKFTTGKSEYEVEFNGNANLPSDDKYYAIYPHDEYNTNNDRYNVLKVEDDITKLIFTTSGDVDEVGDLYSASYYSKTQQITTDGSFAYRANHAFGTCEMESDRKKTTTLKFKNAQALLSFALPATLQDYSENDVKLNSLTITPNNPKESLLGTYTCYFNEVGQPVVDFEADATSQRSIKVVKTPTVNKTPASFNLGKTYYTVVPPTTLTNGINVRLDFSDGKHRTIYNFIPLELNRSKSRSIGTIAYGADLSAVDLSTDVPKGSSMPAFFTSPTTTNDEYSIVGGALQIEKSGSGGTTGYFNIRATDEAVGSYNVLRFKIKYAENIEITNGDFLVHVRAQDNDKTSNGRVYASRVNGKGQDTNVSPVVVDGKTWNIVEIDIKDLHESKSNFKSVSITICPFASNLTASSCNSLGNNRTCWIKDFEFISSNSNNK